VVRRASAGLPFGGVEAGSADSNTVRTHSGWRNQKLSSLRWARSLCRRSSGRASRAVSDSVSMGFDDCAVLRDCGKDCPDVTLAHGSSQSSHGGSPRSVA
jgi:hypothetical protein